MDNVYLIYGEDTYRSNQKLQAIKVRYREKFTELQYLALAGDTVTLQDLEGKLFATAMFASRRLVVLVNVLRDAPKKIHQTLLRGLKSVPDTTVVVFYEQGVVDRRSPLLRVLNRPGFVEQYRLLSSPELIGWVKATVAARGGTIDEQAAQRLTEWVGGNTWRLAQEIEKLLTYRGHIDAEAVQRLVQPEIPTSVFSLLDAIAAGDRRQVVASLTTLIETGQPMLHILSMIGNAIRNTILIKEQLLNEPQATTFQIARTLGLHPYLVTKTIPAARRSQQDALRGKFAAVQKIDQGIKTGTIESRVGLELLVARLLG